jgi:large subunit ribosomal protein L35
MPKQKTHSGAKKRFKISGTGKVLRRKAMQSHNLEKKSAKRRRAFRKDVVLDGSDAREIKKLFPGSGS